MIESLKFVARTVILLLITTTVTAMTPDLSGISFCLDPGHGGEATGAVGPTGLTEKEINLTESFFVYDYLVEHNADTVIMTRTTDINLSLSEREYIANSNNVDYFISLHHNASSNPNTNYSLCLYAEYTAGDPMWPGVADVQSDIISLYHAETKQIPDMGGVGDVSFLGFQLGVLNDLIMPGVLSEPSFISNPPEETRYRNDNYLKTEAEVTFYSYLDLLSEPHPDYGTVIGIAKNPDGEPLHSTFIFLEGFSDTSTTDTIGNGYYRLEQIPPSDYTLTAWNNMDTASTEVSVFAGQVLYTTITLEGPAEPFEPVFNQPVLESVRYSPEDGGIELQWKGDDSSFVAGYRLYRGDAILPDYQLIADESLLTQTTTSWVDTTAQSNSLYNYYFEVIDTSGLYKSKMSDRYPVYFESSVQELLIVDGFDRVQSWTESNHAFAITYGQPASEAGVTFDCAANEIVENGIVSLNDYEAVIWFLGDEGTGSETFSITEQTRVANYLENGGKLFVTGSEVGWDLAREGADPDDRLFYETYLKAEFAGDNASTPAVHGVEGTIFGGLDFLIGQVYPEDYPDFIIAYDGSTVNLKYGNNLKAGVQYEGTFGSGTTPGKLVYMGFPLETISSSQDKSELITAILEFFEMEMSVDGFDETEATPEAFTLSPPFPNPANGIVVIPYTVTTEGRPMHLIIYDLLGRTVLEISLGYTTPGKHSFRWNLKSSAGRDVASGGYWILLTNGERSQTRKVVVIK